MSGHLVQFMLEVFMKKIMPWWGWIFTHHYSVYRRLRQGWKLFLDLFKLYGKFTLEWNIGRVCKCNINPRFADDITLIAASGVVMETLIIRAKRENRRSCLKMNKAKAKIVFIHYLNSNQSGNTFSKYKLVDTLFYARSIISSDGSYKL